MVAAERALHAVTNPVTSTAAVEAVPVRGVCSTGDVALTATILVVGLLPLLCDRLGIGEWSAGTLGLGAIGAVLALRELAGLTLRRAPR